MDRRTQDGPIICVVTEKQNNSRITELHLVRLTFYHPYDDLVLHLFFILEQHNVFLTDVSTVGFVLLYSLLSPYRLNIVVTAIWLGFVS